MAGWSKADIPPQAGRIAIVTGATSGLGYETALALARAGTHVVPAARNAQKAADAIGRIRQAHRAAALEFRQLDTASLASVRSFATAWREDGRPIDALVLNAGIASVPAREETADGFERQLATNYLGHFALAGLLLPSMRRASATRVVPVASIAHRRAELRLDDLQLRRSYDPSGAYGQSKLAMLMFGLELDRRLRAAESPILSVPAHPGMAVTDIFRRGDRAGFFGRLAGKIRVHNPRQSAARGALPILYAATAPDALGGAYYGPDGIREIRGDPAPAKIEPHAADRGAAERLWSQSEALTGVTFPL